MGKIKEIQEKPFFKIALSFLLSTSYLGFSALLNIDHPSISTVMKLFGIGGFVVTFLYLFVTVSSWSETLEEKIKEYFLFWLEIANTLLLISVIAFSIRFFVIQPFIVRGSSMEPNFHDGQILVVNEISYRLGKDPERGDVVVFKYPKNPREKYIKRIMGLPGESVVMHNGNIYIKGTKDSKEEKQVKEDYIPYTTQTDENLSQQWDLTEEEYFVMGDNRLPGGSSDSRSWGPLPEKNIVGKVWVILWPFSDFGFFSLPEYSL